MRPVWPNSEFFEWPNKSDANLRLALGFFPPVLFYCISVLNWNQNYAIYIPRGFHFTIFKCQMHIWIKFKLGQNIFSNNFFHFFLFRLLSFQMKISKIDSWKTLRIIFFLKNSPAFNHRLHLRPPGKKRNWKIF